MSSDKLYLLAKKVVEDSNELTQIWTKLDFHDKHGHLPDEGFAKTMNVEDMNIRDIVTKLLTLPSYISKTKKKISAMPDGADKDILIANVAAKEVELKAIKDLRHDETI